MDWMWRWGSVAEAGIAAWRELLAADDGEGEEEDKVDSQPDLDPYDPRKPEYTVPARPHEIKAAELQLLDAQMQMLAGALRRQQRTRRMPQQVAAHYERMLVQMQREADSLAAGAQSWDPGASHESLDDPEDVTEEGEPASPCRASRTAGQALFGGSSPSSYLCHCPGTPACWPFSPTAAAAGPREHTGRARANSGDIGLGTHALSCDADDIQVPTLRRETSLVALAAHRRRARYKVPPIMRSTSIGAPSTHKKRLPRRKALSLSAAP